MKTTIRNITGEVIEVENLTEAIRQCRECMGSPYKMPSGHTVVKTTLIC